MYDSGYWILDTGCLILDIGFLMFDTVYNVNAPDFPSWQEGSPEAEKFFGEGLCAREGVVFGWMYDSGYWMLDTGCLILDIGFLMFDHGNFFNPLNFPSCQEGSPEAEKFFGEGLCAREGVVFGKMLDIRYWIPDVRYLNQTFFLTSKTH